MRKCVKQALETEYSISMYKKKPLFDFIKRFFDIILSLTAILLLSWLFIILAILVKCSSKGPVFYGHSRVGKNGKMFKVLKFRSMICDNRPLEEVFTPEQMEEWKRDFKVVNDPRVTKIGKFLRKTSLDELPQLFNIFIGTMSFVGTRPITRRELTENFTEEEQKILTSGKPGLTGYWQVYGRGQAEYETGERQKLELEYFYRRGLFFDFKLLFLTIPAVLKHKGAK